MPETMKLYKAIMRLETPGVLEAGDLIVTKDRDGVRTHVMVTSVELKEMKARAPKKGPTEPHPCLCGCGEIIVTGSKFRPGHDSRHHAAIAAGFKTWAEKKAAEVEEKTANAAVKAEAKAAMEKVKAEKAEARMRAKEAKILAEAEKAEARKAKAEAEVKRLEELKAKAAKPVKEVEKAVSEDLKNGRKEAIKEAAKKYKQGK